MLEANSMVKSLFTLKTEVGNPSCVDSTVFFHGTRLEGLLVSLMQDFL